MPDSGVQMVGTLYINFKNSGWAERYFLPTANYADAKTGFAGLCALRALALGANCAIVWARVSFADRAKDGVAAIDHPLEPSKAIMTADPNMDANINDPFTSLHFRFETGTGKWANRLFRGIPDDLVQNFSLGSNVIVPPPGLGPLVIAANTTYNQVFGALLGYIRDFTVYGKRPTPPAVIWHTENWANCMFRRISSRKTGRPFGMFRGRAPSFN